MVQSPPADILRNTATLEAWRAYNRKANAPLMLAMVPTTAISAATPAMIALSRHSHSWLPLLVLAVVGEVLALAWLIIVAFKVHAYKRAHPFVPPPRVTWRERKATPGRS
jgi:hypothetical protein